MNGREPFAATAAGSTRATGRPAEPSAAAISAGPARRSGTPNTTSAAAPAVTPAAKARTTSAGEAVPVISRTPAASHSVIQAARRHGRASHGAAATAHATAAAPSAGPSQRRAGQPRPRAGPGRQGARTLPAGQLNDPDRPRRPPARHCPPARAAAGTGGNAT